jgi:tetrapyrrole methylase family protein/MazG family protein
LRVIEKTGNTNKGVQNLVSWQHDRKQLLQPTKAGITIAGLGAGSPEGLTIGVLTALEASSCTYLRTGKHPVVDWLRDRGIEFTTFDSYYEQADSFGQVYERIAREVVEQAKDKQVLYAVPGHPLVAEASVQLIIEQAGAAGLEVKVLPAVSFLDAVCTALRLDPGKGLQVLDGLRLDEMAPLVDRPAIITQVYSRLVASDVKLDLMEFYPPEHPVTIIRAAGIEGEERIESHPLYELDRIEWLDHLTSVYLPEINPEQETVGADTGHRTAVERNTGAPQVFQVREDSGEDRAAGSFLLDPLVNIMARLRGEGGCPWDREQDHQSLKPYLIEEAYEVLEALDEGDAYKICEELGDLLLQIVFHAQIARENQQFDINDVIDGISEKMIRRHPHVFGALQVSDSDEVLINWEKIKSQERAGEPYKGLLDSIPVGMPALMRAYKLQKKAARVGFDWPDYLGSYNKVLEELGELIEAVDAQERLKMEQEFGDLLFAAVNLGRLLGLEPEGALSKTSTKFIKRFKYMEEMARAEGKDISHFSLAEMDKWWEEAKALEK